MDDKELFKWPLCVHGKRVIDCVPCTTMISVALRPWREKVKMLEDKVAARALIVEAFRPEEEDNEA